MIDNNTKEDRKIDIFNMLDENTEASILKSMI